MPGDVPRAGFGQGRHRRRPKLMNNFIKKLQKSRHNSIFSSKKLSKQIFSSSEINSTRNFKKFVEGIQAVQEVIAEAQDVAAAVSKAQTKAAKEALSRWHKIIFRFEESTLNLKIDF